MLFKNEMEDLMETFLEKKQPGEVTNFAMAIHRGAVASGASPRHYFSMIQTYRKIYEKIRSSSGSQNSHLETGLNKLQEAKELVDIKTKEAQIQKEELKIKQKASDQALKEIQKAMGKAAAKKQEIEKIDRALGAEQKKIAIQETQI